MSISSSIRASAPAVRVPRVVPGAVTLGVAIFAALLALGPKLLGDPDTQWHVAVGRMIWRDGAVPWTDTLSHTFAGSPWIAKEWLSQLALAGAYGAAGWRGPVLLAAAALALLFGLIFAQLARQLRGTIALVATLLAVMVLAPHFLARPHVLAHLCLFGWTVGLVRASERGTAPSLWLLPLLALWANLHGSFAFAYPLAAAMGLDALWAAPPGRRLALLRAWIPFGLGALAAGCATPYGIEAIRVTVTLFGSGESLPFIDEWQPLALDLLGASTIASALALAVGLGREPARNAVRLLLLAGIFAMVCRHVRFLDVYGIVAPLLAATPIARAWPRLRPEPAEAPPRADRQAAALAGLALLAIAAVTVREPQPSAAVTPVEGLAAARRAGLAGPVYNAYDFGGFLLREGVPSFIDGRTDQLFLGGFITRLYGAVTSREDGPFRDLLDRYGVTWAIVQPQSPDAGHLDRLGWRRVHGDATAAVYGRP